MARSFGCTAFNLPQYSHRYASSGFKRFAQKIITLALEASSGTGSKDYADVTQLVCLANLESLNAEFIRQGLTQSARLLKLNDIAIIQLKSLLRHRTVKKLAS